MRSSVRTWLGLVAVWSLLVGGCATPPDVKPFSDSTQALTLGVGSVQKSVSDELARVNDAALTTQFHQEWDARVKAMNAMSDYAEALVGVVEAGNKGGETAQAVLDAGKEFLTTVGVAAPAGSAVATAVQDAVVLAFKKVVADRAAHTVADALKAADPAVQDVANALAADLPVMKKVLATLRTDALRDYTVKAKTAPDDPLNAVRVADVSAQLGQLRRQQATQPSAADVRAKLDELDHEMARPAYAKFLAEEKEINDRFDAYDRLIDQAADLTTAWGMSHKKLIAASAQNITPSFHVLIETTREFLEIYKEARKAK
jgi:hypothetical protein